MNWRTAGAVFRKDALSLLPLLSLAALLFLADAVIVRTGVFPLWADYDVPILLVGLLVVVLSVFQLDSPASQVDDWLCRPLGRRELIGAKLLLVLAVVYAPRVLGVFVTDIVLGASMVEALLDAILLQEEVLVALAPILLFTAIVTRTFVQGFGVLFAIFIVAFVIPTPFVRPPGPLTPGLRDALFVSGSQWRATTPAMILACVLLAAGLWLAYGRRRVGPARVLLALTVVATVACFLIPMSTPAVSDRGTGDPEVRLHPIRACFPATWRAALGGDAAFAAVSRNLGEWEEEALRDVGANSVAFMTAVAPAGLPPDWRAKLEDVSAEYVAGGRAPIALRPAKYFTDGADGGPLRHEWMLPESELRTLQAAHPELRLTYSLALLQPREYRLATDGVRRRLPGLGYCGARLDEAGDRIVVDCFTSEALAQVTAELDGIPASRAASEIDFSPRWTRWAYAQRVRLVISPARLAEHDTITVTAWRTARHVRNSLQMRGILGGDLGTCPLPDPGAGARMASSWRDVAPHKVYSIAVDAGVRLEVLDFGGSGAPIVLLPGLGATAHAFDELAPSLAARHHVIAITRRGTGGSSRPGSGFQTPRLAQDVLAVLDQLRLDKVLLVGHSIAGDELTWLGGHHAERFSGLVYLDAAYDRSGDGHDARSRRLRELRRMLPPEPPFPPQALVDAATFNAYLERQGHSRLPEGELIAFFNLSEPFLAGTPNIDARAAQAITAAIRPPDYARVAVPALALYAFERPNHVPPWIDATDARVMAALAEIRRLEERQKRENLEAFRHGVPRAEVLELHDATHYVMQSNPRQVIEALENFGRPERDARYQDAQTHDRPAHAGR